MLTLTEKEFTAIESRYFGWSYSDIAEKIDVPKQTVNEWFKTRGKLKPYYEEFVTKMNEQRETHLKENLQLLDSEVAVVMRLYVKKFQEVLIKGQKKVLMQNGEPVLDKNGQVQYYYEPFQPSFIDVERAWKMQRTMNGLPTQLYEKQCLDCKIRLNTIL